MQTPPKTGTTHSKTYVVLNKYAVDFAIPELPPVLSTPSVILFLERTAVKLMQPFLEPKELTVGVNVDIEHLAPSPIGSEIICTARVIQCDGPVITFQVEARDATETVAKGLHKRRVVNASRLGDRVRKKQQGESGSASSSR